MTKIIAFGHRKRVGKDTSAKLLDTILRVERPNIRVVKLSFASKLKDVCYQLFHWAGLKPGIFYEDERNAHLREETLPKIGKSPRQLWIEVGNKMREVYPPTWIDNALYGTPEADILLITDLRFPNEAKKIKELGGKCIKLVRASAPVANDESDAALDGFPEWDQILENHGNMHELHVKIEALAQEVLQWLATG